jgi:hypothetical protein
MRGAIARANSSAISGTPVTLSGRRYPSHTLHASPRGACRHTTTPVTPRPPLRLISHRCAPLPTPWGCPAASVCCHRIPYSSREPLHGVGPYRQQTDTAVSLWQASEEGSPRSKDLREIWLATPATSARWSGPHMRRASYCACGDGGAYVQCPPWPHLSNVVTPPRAIEAFAVGRQQPQ